MQNQLTPDLNLMPENLSSGKNLSSGNPLFLGIVLGLILLAALAGIAPFWDISPLIVGGFGCAMLIGLVYLRAPTLALYSTIFVSLLPQGLLSDTIQSDLSLLLLVISLLFWGIQTGFQRRKIVWTAPFLWMVAFILWALITVLWADNLVVSRQTLVQYTIVLTVFFLLINQVDSPRALDDLMKTLALSGWVLIGIGLWTVLFGGYERGTRLQIFDMNENMLGVLLMLATPGVIWQVIRATPQKKTRLMLLSLIYIVFALLLIALSGSRGSFIGFALILLIFGTLQTTRPWALWGAAIGIVGLLITPFVFATVLDRFISATDDFYGERDVLWKAGIWLIDDHPWTGVGIGNGPYVMLNYVNRISDVDHVNDYTTRPAHNPIIEVGDDTGIIGMVLYLGVLLSALGLFLRPFGVAIRQRFARIAHKSAAPQPPERSRDKTLLDSYSVTAYGSLIFCISIGVLSAWLKSGGLANHLALFILLALWVIPHRLQTQAAAAQNFGETGMK